MIICITYTDHIIISIITIITIITMSCAYIIHSAAYCHIVISSTRACKIPKTKKTDTNNQIHDYLYEHVERFNVTSEWTYITFSFPSPVTLLCLCLKYSNVTIVQSFFINPEICKTQNGFLYGLRGVPLFYDKSLSMYLSDHIMWWILLIADITTN